MRFRLGALVRLLVAGAAVLALAVGCGDDGEEATTPTTSSSSTTSSTGGEEESTTTTSPTSTTSMPAASTTSVFVPSGSVADLVWDRSASPGPDGVVTSAIEGGPGLVAVGFTSDEDGGNDAAAWVSSDGEAWEPAVVEEGGGRGIQRITSVAVGGPGFVGVGFHTTLVLAEPWEAVVWVSEDGFVWERVRDPSFAESEAQEMWGVTTGGPGLVAVGFAHSAEFVNDPAVWVSADGVSWDRVAEEMLAAPGHQGIGDQHDPSVVNGPAGLVAVGFETTDAGDSVSAVWASEDGLEWERVEDADLEQGIDLLGFSAVAATPSRYAVIGLTASPLDDRFADVGVWLSSDGRTWSLVADPVFAVEGEQVAAAVTAFGDELVVVGWHLGGPDPGRDLVWHSLDGATWEASQDPALDVEAGRPMFALTHPDQMTVLGVDRAVLRGRLAE